MTFKCIIINVFNTTVGIIAIIGFDDNNFPCVGMTLQDSKGHAWKLKSLSIGRKAESNIEIPSDYTSIWDCNLEPINHNYPITKGDFLSGNG